MVPTIKEIKDFAHWNFSIENEWQVTSDKDEEFAVADPWMDYTGRFIINDDVAFETWGLDVIVDFSLKAQAAMEHLFDVHEASRYNGNYFYGCLENGRYFIAGEMFVKFFDEDPVKYFDSFFWDWQNEHTDDYLASMMNDEKFAKFMKDVREHLSDKKEMIVSEAFAMYTGGGVWVFYGRLKDGSYFLFDDTIMRIIDENPEDNMDDCFFQEWQDAHAVNELEESLNLENARKLRLDVLDYLVRNPENGNGITREEIRILRNAITKPSEFNNEKTIQADGETVKIKYHSQEINELEYIDGKSDWIDLRSAENVHLNKGDFHLIDLGISVKLPEGYEMIIAPRSSTFKNFGVIQTNSIGVIDESYCGDNDILKMPVVAMRDTEIHVNDRICQFRLIKHQPTISFKEVDSLGNESRGGFGSTGVQ